MAHFNSVDEFKRVFEQILHLMNDHPKIGRTLRDAKAPHRFEITDRFGQGDEVWSDESQDVVSPPSGCTCAALGQSLTYVFGEQILTADSIPAGRRTAERPD